MNNPDKIKFETSGFIAGKTTNIAVLEDKL